MTSRKHLWRREGSVALMAAAILGVVLASAGFATPARKAAPGADQAPIQGVAKLQGILVVAGAQEVKPEGVSGIKGVEVRGPAFGIVLTRTVL